MTLVGKSGVEDIFLAGYDETLLLKIITPG